LPDSTGILATYSVLSSSIACSPIEQTTMATTTPPRLKRFSMATYEVVMNLVAFVETQTLVSCATCEAFATQSIREPHEQVLAAVVVVSRQPPYYCDKAAIQTIFQPIVLGSQPTHSESPTYSPSEHALLSSQPPCHAQRLPCATTKPVSPPLQPPPHPHLQHLNQIPLQQHPTPQQLRSKPHPSPPTHPTPDSSAPAPNNKP
jgi:hypothetical protein